MFFNKVSLKCYLQIDRKFLIYSFPGGFYKIKTFKMENRNLAVILAAILVIGFTELKCIRGCPDFGTREPSLRILEHPKPKLVLRLDQPKKNTVDKYFHHLDSNIVLINMTGLLTVRLDCWAPYPIDLQFSGHLTNQETTIKTFRKEFGPRDKPKSCFIINATMETYEQITGNYSCNSVEQPSIFSSYYIFVSPSPPGVILTRGQNIFLQPNMEDRHIIFPCAVSHPEVHVQLFKEDETEPLPQSDELLYDPKVGFIMKIINDDTSLFGRYICRTELSPNDVVNFTLIPPRNFKVSPSITNIRIGQNKMLNITCEATDKFQITYIPRTLPIEHNIKVIESENSLARYKYTGSFFASSLPANVSGIVSCQWKSSNRTFASWTFSVLEKDTIRPGLLDISRLQSCPNVKEIILYECSNSVECRINSCLRKDVTCNSNGRMCIRGDYCMKSGLIQCSSSGVSSSLREIFFTGYPVAANKTNRYVDWKHAPTEELLLLEESKKNQTKDNIKEFFCQGSNFVFASGFKWTLVFDDGTRIKVNSLDEAIEDHMNISVRNTWRAARSNLQSKLIISLGYTPQNISHIECAAPVWNSWDWINQTIRVNIPSRRHLKRNFAQPVTQPKTMSWIAPVCTILYLISFSYKL